MFVSSPLMSELLVALYAGSAALETRGIAFVVAEWRDDRRRLRELAGVPMKVHSGTIVRMPSRERSIMRRGGERATSLLDERLASVERQLRAVLSNYERADAASASCARRSAAASDGSAMSRRE